MNIRRSIDRSLVTHGLSWPETYPSSRYEQRTRCAWQPNDDAGTLPRQLDRDNPHRRAPTGLLRESSHTRRIAISDVMRSMADPVRARSDCSTSVAGARRRVSSAHGLPWRERGPPRRRGR
jgi:hypothetical protein